MVKNRLIAVLIIRDGQVVQSIHFKHTNVIHWNPVEAIDVFNEWAIDEVIVLNVSRTNATKDKFVNILTRLAEKCFVPLAAGGWVENLADAAQLIRNGADKVIVNTAAYRRPDLITDIADKFGNQCCVVSIDAKRDENSGKQLVYIDRGREPTEQTPLSWAKAAVKYGAGEIFYNSINHDGNREGYDLGTVRELADYLSVPVIAFGGVFTWQHLADGILIGNADAVAAANIFHYTEHSVIKAKRFLLGKGLNFRGI
jgi:cyclase